MTPRRVLLTTDAVGGVWTYSVDLARALGEIGIETILVTTGPPPIACQCANVAAIANVTLVETDTPLDWLAPDAATIAAAGRRIATLARDHGVDLVQLNAPAFAADAAFDVPVVAVAHSCLGSWWDAVEDGALPADFAWRDAVTRAGLLAADAVVAPSHALAAALGRIHRLPVLPSVVHNGRAPAAFAPQRLANHAFTAGRLWDRGKNLATLDRAGARGAPILAAGPLVGPGGDAVALDRLTCLGMLDPAALEAHLAARPVFVSAALYEPFGLAILEAAQAGCALVLAGIPTLRELWQDAAIFVDPHDAEGFAAVITGLLADPADRERRGETAAIHAARYTIAAMRDGMAALYASVLRARSERVAA